MHLRIGTRGSSLALAQVDIFIKNLQKFEDFTFEIITIKTTGDKILDRPLYDIGGKAMFLKELEDALLNNVIDVAIHSLKDVPGILEDKFKLACYLKRESSLDCFISKKASNIMGLKPYSTIGSSSPRRNSFIKNIRPDLVVVPIRGNVDKRIQKLLNGEIDAIILATVGLKRLRLFDESYCNPIEIEEFIPCVGQGVITAEILHENLILSKILEQLNDKDTKNCVEVEREFLARLNASCRTPIAAYVYKVGDFYKGSFMLSSDNMEKMVIKRFDSIELKKNFGMNVAESMISLL